MDWLEIITTVVTVILAVVGSGVVGYVVKGSKVAKEIGELLTTVGVALEDGTLTKEEAAKIFKEFNDIPNAIAAFKVKTKK